MRSGMTLVNSGNGEIVEEKFGGKMRRGKGVLECALEEAEEACGRLREENAEVKGLVVDVTNTVQRILQKALGKDPDGEDAVRVLTLSGVWGPESCLYAEFYFTAGE